MENEIMTEDPNGTKPTDIIGDSLDPIDDEVADTLERPAPEEPAPEQLPPAPALRGIPNLTSYVKRHPRGVIVLALVSIATIFMLVLAWRRSNNVPDLDFIDQDARARIEAPTYSGGYFGNDDRLILTQVTVGTRTHSDHAPEGSDLEETFGSMGYVTADVMLTYQNESVMATKTAVLGYARQNDGWIAAGDVSNEQVSFVATSGVNQRKVLRNIGQVLERASSVGADDELRPSLATVYEGAVFEVTSSTFDDAAQTDTLTIHARKGGVFSAYECDIVATFAFRQTNGLWELTEATVTDDAWTRRFDPLIGTWDGTFKSQEVNAGTKCLAGSSNPMMITITSWETAGTGARITGTVSAVVHYHPNPEKDQNTSEGDEVLVDVPFTATLVDPSNKQLGSEAVFTATLPETAGGKVSITLQFGVGEDGAGVTATITTEHHFEDTIIFIPYQKQVIYSDTYELVLVPTLDDQEQEPEPQDGQQTPEGEQQAPEEPQQDESA